METIIYGGSFNPPTRAHEAIIQLCLDRSDAKEVWVMPSGERFDKQYRSDDTDRRWMLEYMREEVFGNDPHLYISCFELDYVPRPTQTYKTVEALGKYFPDRQFRFVFGADAYKDMPNWQDGAKLQQTLPMLVIARNGIVLPHAENIIIVRCDLKGSSTEVRQRIMAGQPIDQFVCEGVRRYIEGRKLYT